MAICILWSLVDLVFKISNLNKKIFESSSERYRVLHSMLLCDKL